MVLHLRKTIFRGEAHVSGSRHPSTAASLVLGGCPGCFVTRPAGSTWTPTGSDRQGWHPPGNRIVIGVEAVPLTGPATAELREAWLDGSIRGLRDSIAECCQGSLRPSTVRLPAQPVATNGRWLLPPTCVD